MQNNYMKDIYRIVHLEHPRYLGFLLCEKTGFKAHSAMCTLHTLETLTHVKKQLVTCCACIGFSLREQ